MQAFHQVLSALKSRAHLREAAPDWPIVVIETPHASAEIALHGAQVLSWTPAGHDPVIYLSPDAIYQEGTPVRGGVPVCWPWFNAHPTDPSKPSHGFARNRFWKLTKAVDYRDSVRLMFQLHADEATRKLWPYDFSAWLTVRIGTELSVSLQTINFGNQAFTIGSALHSYLQVGDIEQISIHGLDSTDYLDTVGEHEMRTQLGPVLVDREIDRIYQTADPIELHDATLGRVVTVEKAGSNSSVIWNPWKEKAAALHDLPDQDFRKFVCIETANAGKDLITVEPGQTHALTTALRVSPLT